MECFKVLSHFKVWLCILIVISGTINIIGAKFMNVQETIGTDGIRRCFNHPFVQTWGIFLGGTFILIVALIVSYCKRSIEEHAIQGPIL